MRKLIFLFAVAAIAVGLVGCAGPEQKLSRGLSNTFELVRWGDMRQSVEQNAVFSAPDVNYSYGIVHGFDQSIKRASLGVLETATFFIPNPKSLNNWNYKSNWEYTHPLFTNSVPAVPQYPDSYTPGIIADTSFQTDTHTGFSGGDIAPLVPGSRFQIFDN